jgi:hypothetical protein
MDNRSIPRMTWTPLAATSPSEGTAWMSNSAT